MYEVCEEWGLEKGRESEMCGPTIRVWRCAQRDPLSYLFLVESLLLFCCGEDGQTRGDKSGAVSMIQG